MDKKKILMIDDEVDYTNITKVYLEEAGDYEVHVVNQGKRGYPVAKEIHPDIVLLDVSMPDISGYEVARQFEADGELRDIPIVFFTGVYEEVKDKEVLRGRPFLTKPTSGEQLVSFIQNHLKL